MKESSGGVYMKLLTCYSCEGFDEQVENRREGSGCGGGVQTGGQVTSPKAPQGL